MKTVFAIFLLGVFTLSAAPLPEDPYGVCAHVSRNEPIEQTFKAMHDAGITWVRTDFDWSPVEPSPGQWNFSRLDRLINTAQSEKINILPILNAAPSWATPAWKYPGPWRTFVHTIVSHYSKNLRYWEIWNEPNNSGVWRDSPNGGNYARHLQCAFEEIRRIDPNLKVVYAGVAGVPLDFIENSFKAGAHRWFDVMNIHPYHCNGGPELLVGELRALRELMTRYGIGDKPIWITETGISTAQQNPLYTEVLPVALKRLGFEPGQVSAAVIYDPASGYEGTWNFFPDRNKTFFREIIPVTLDGLSSLDPHRCPVLIPAAGQYFPCSYMPALVSYVKRGGTLLLPAGLPFYYDLQLNGKGAVARTVQVNEKHCAGLHIGWESWWTNPDVPKQENYQRPAAEFKDQFQITFQPTSRFLHTRNLKPGDTFIPLIEAGTDSYHGTVAGIYRLNSDLKGNVIVFTAMLNTGTVTEAGQAEQLPRTFLIALACGVERIFPYNLRALENTPENMEHHFGIVHRDFSPKPAWYAYRTLTQLCPNGSTRPDLAYKEDIYEATWKRPDNQIVTALWSPQTSKTIIVPDKYRSMKILDHLGNPRIIPENGEIAISAGPTYFVGQEQLLFTRTKNAK